MSRFSIVFSALLVLLAGCWTFNTSDYPETALSAAPTNSVAKSVALIGFESTLVERVAMTGYQTFYVPSVYVGHGRHHHYYRPGYYEAIPTTTFVDQRYQTDLFLRRAKDMLETAGYTIAAQTPAWTVEVQFEGPFRSSSESSKEALVVIGSVFFCDYASVTWNAKLKIRDNRTGELVFSHAYEQKFETNAFGLIPLFGIASCDETSQNAMQVWCLSALTDRALADATTFLSSFATR